MLEFELDAERWTTPMYTYNFFADKDTLHLQIA